MAASVNRFLDALRRKESMARVPLFQVLGGHPLPPGIRRYVGCNERIRRLIGNFPDMAAIPYL